MQEVAVKLGVDIKPYDLGQNVSGVLLIHEGKGTIGVNPNDSLVRQRFTIAHEIAHYVLHRQKTELFVDKQFSILFRSDNPSTAELRIEREANAYAAALLMPVKLLQKQIRSADFNLSDDKGIKKLAEKFQVSEIAMTYRLTNLNLF